MKVRGFLGPAVGEWAAEETICVKKVKMNEY
jgi:hypothetical protein